MRGMTLRALFILVMLIPGAARPQETGSEAGGESPKVSPLTLIVMNWLGEPLMGVRFQAIQQTSDTPAISLETGPDGRATLDRPAGETFLVRSVDDRFMTEEPEQTAMPNDRMQVWRLFASDTSTLAAEERRELAVFWPRIRMQTDWTTPPALPAELTDLRLLRFIEPHRVEAEEAIELEGSKFAGDGTFAFRVLDERGRSAPSVLTRLYVLDEATGKIQPVGVARSAENGGVAFEGLSREYHFRARIVDVPGIPAQTGIALPKEAGKSMGSLILRRQDERIAGFVVRKSKPAVDAIVRTELKPGARSLTTSTDASGYFILGPVNEQVVSIVVTLNTEHGAVSTTWNARTGREEFINLDLLTD